MLYPGLFCPALPCLALPSLSWLPLLIPDLPNPSLPDLTHHILPVCLPACLPTSQPAYCCSPLLSLVLPAFLSSLVSGVAWCVLSPSHSILPRPFLSHITLCTHAFLYIPLLSITCHISHLISPHLSLPPFPHTSPHLAPHTRPLFEITPGLLYRVS